MILIVDLLHDCFIWKSFCEGHLLTESLVLWWYYKQMWTLTMVLGCSPWESLELLMIETEIIHSWFQSPSLVS